MPAYMIRPAQRSDIRAIVGLWHEMMAFHSERDPRFRFGPTAQRDLEQHIHSTIRSRESFLLVAAAGEAVVGSGKHSSVHMQKIRYQWRC